MVRKQINKNNITGYKGKNKNNNNILPLTLSSRAEDMHT